MNKLKRLRVFSLSRTPQSAAGASIVEVVISTLILALAAVGSLMLYTTLTKFGLSSKSEGETQAAIEEDLANILNANRRFTCNGTDPGAAGCKIEVSSDPGEDGYYPSLTNSNAVTDFKSRCATNTIASTLIPLLSSSSLAVPSSFSRLGLSRSASLPVDVTASDGSSSDSSNHQYVIIWTKSGTPIRQITLRPTVANWCP
jgi:hypothetical protein